ncbi:piggyBac transposable element-derived protein 4-like [Homalodisca vitripennis]|uniref:piggyBac transposable element-derived protein 4-like n=1 Tax=Homalodisca vitripennis TaxID=197043 RepID=UPI001EEBB99C|nr:piggyBac transposable element-derived protein 4-like [Homalodisca vitripennis]
MWDNSMGTGVEALYLTMSNSRFRFLLRCLRFDNVHSREQRKSLDSLAAFREIFETFVSNCKTSYKPTDYLTIIDEQLVAFRGNCTFRVYMPSKPAKYGLKIFALASTTNYYASNLEVYVRKQPNGPFNISNSTQDLVLRLVEPISGTNRNVTLDNWFTSVPIAMKLREEKRLTMVGTLRKNKREVPPNFLPDAAKELKSSIFGFQKNCTLVSYVPKKKKAVLAISTMHDNAAIYPATGDDRKPVIITTYNNTKYGVDVLDKMCRQYDTARNSRRWHLTLFFHVLNVGGVNGLCMITKTRTLLVGWNL